MAIKITDTVYTDKGASKELYVSIGTIIFDKKLKSMYITTNTFFDKSHRDGNMMKCMTFVIKSNYILYWDGTDMIDSNAFKLAYIKLTEVLEAEEHNTEEI